MAAREDKGSKDQQLTARFKASMEQKKITQAQLGSKMTPKRSQAYVNNLFRGVKSYSPDDMHDIADALDVSIDDIVRSFAEDSEPRADEREPGIKNPAPLGEVYSYLEKWFGERKRKPPPGELGSYAATVLMQLESSGIELSAIKDDEERETKLRLALLEEVMARGKV